MTTERAEDLQPESQPELSERHWLFSLALVLALCRSNMRLATAPFYLCTAHFQFKWASVQCEMTRAYGASSLSHRDANWFYLIYYSKVMSSFLCTLMLTLNSFTFIEGLPIS